MNPVMDDQSIEIIGALTLVEAELKHRIQQARNSGQDTSTLTNRLEYIGYVKAQYLEQHTGMKLNQAGAGLPPVNMKTNGRWYFGLPHFHNKR